MNNKTYYGVDNSKTITYLEFGEIDIQNSQKKIWNFQLHQKAYDWLMLGRYANDLQSAVTMQQLLSEDAIEQMLHLYNKEVHHSDEASLNLSKLLALCAAKDNTDLSAISFYELGQTIFGCIEGMEFYSALLKHLKIDFPVIDLKNVEWYGVDISEMFNQLSVTFHRAYKVKTMFDSTKLPDKIDVFFSKGITLLYAVRKIEDLFNTIEKSRVSIFDYSFSLDKTEDTTIGSGKTVRYLQLKDFLSALKNRKQVLYVKKSNSRFIPETNRIWLDCLFAEEKICQKYIELDTKIRLQVFKKLSSLPSSERFLNNDKSPKWLPIDKFIESINLK
ncbi:MAG: hypothetical protein HY841_03425 [Bacteroidetes bacterium]|nr:hypothetical protein [Bacteroidota bacterium]